jgi:hypothetical protein
VEDGTDGSNGYFRRNSGYSAEKKNFGIPFRTLPRKRKQLGIPFRGTKIEASSRNSVPNLQATCSILTTQLIFPIQPNIQRILSVISVSSEDLQYRSFSRLYYLSSVSQPDIDAVFANKSNNGSRLRSVVLTFRLITGWGLHRSV